MELYSRRGLHGAVVDNLGRRIVNGHLAEGSRLDVDLIGVEFQVSRTVMREVLRALSTKGLLDARPKVGTFVLPRQMWNLLDPDVMRWRAEEGASPSLLTDLDELRQLIEPWAATRAAVHRTPDQLRELLRHLEELGSDTSAGDDAEQWRRHIDALIPLNARSDNFHDLHRAVAVAIESQDPEAARTAMTVLLQAAAEDVRPG
jgi:GntR family galactonate operon transcriptional repressor